KFHFPTDFVVVDYVVDPWVPLILGRPFLRTRRDLIDVYGEELTLRVDDEEITFKVGQTSKYSYNDAESINRIDVIDVACEDLLNNKEKLFNLAITPVNENCSAVILKKLPEKLRDPDKFLISCDFPELALADLGIDDTDFDLEGDIHLLEKLLNDDPSSFPLPPKELNVEEIKTIKSSIDELPELELKDLPSHLEYTFLEGTDKLPVIIS
nr:DNA-directed DNA polymerase [Tanacetum cinerariifolium]